MKKTSFAEIILTVCLFCIGTFHEYLSCIAATAMLVWFIYKVIHNKKLYFSLNLTSVAVLCITLFYGLTAFWAVDGGMAVIGFMKFLPVPLYLLVLMQTNDTEDIIKRLPITAAVMTVISAIGMQIPIFESFFSVSGRLAGFFQYSQRILRVSDYEYDSFGNVILDTSIYYDGNDNDWWRTDYGDDDDYGNDDDWVDDYDDYGDDDQNNPDIPVVTPTESDKVYVKCKDGTLCLDLEKTKVYVISDKDKLVKELTNIPLGYKQVFPQASCIFAGLAFSYEVLTGSNVDHEADMLNKYGEIKGYDKLEDMMRNGSNAETVQWLLEYYYDLKPENSGSVLLYPTFELPNSSFSNFIDEGYVLMTNISIGKENEDSTDHNIVVVGYNDDGLICYDTLYGKVIELDASDFNQDYVIVLNKPNEEAFSGNKK